MLDCAIEAHCRSSLIFSHLQKYNKRKFDSPLKFYVQGIKSSTVKDKSLRIYFEARFFFGFKISRLSRVLRVLAVVRDETNWKSNEREKLRKSF